MLGFSELFVLLVGLLPFVIVVFLVSGICCLSGFCLGFVLLDGLYFSVFVICVLFV